MLLQRSQLCPHAGIRPGAAAGMAPLARCRPAQTSSRGTVPGWRTAGCRCLQHRRGAHRAHAASSELDFDALLFDCDGVLCDTERDGHRVAFNQAFEQKDLSVTWSPELYGELLSTGGGKERMTRHFTELGDQGPFSSRKAEPEQKQLVQDLHLLKTDLFMQMIDGGSLPLRSGVKRLIGEAQAAGLQVAVCSTSNERAVQKIVDVLIGGEAGKRIRVYAGDVVPRKKPDPAIYLLAAEELGVEPDRCVVVEDSDIGLRAAKAAGMRCLVTMSSYTGGEDFSKADRVVSELGDSGADVVHVADLTAEALQKHK